MVKVYAVLWLENNYENTTRKRHAHNCLSHKNVLSGCLHYTSYATAFPVLKRKWAKKN